LRYQKDDILKQTSNSCDVKVSKVISDARHILFDQDLISQDEQKEPEILPQPILSGMGGYSGDTGFGNAPISKENIGHKMLDLIDKAVNSPDERAEVLKLCLENPSVGEFKPVNTQMMSASTVGISQTGLMTAASAILTGRKHVPGRPGGGWESSDEDIIDEQDAKLDQSMSEVSLNSSPVKRDIMVESARLVILKNKSEDGNTTSNTSHLKNRET
jgi:hypothetical protein